LSPFLNREIAFAAAGGVISGPLDKLVVAGSENIIETSRVTDRDAEVLGGANDEGVVPANTIQRSAEVGATAGGDKNGFGGVDVQPSGLRKNFENSFESGKIGDDVGGANRNIICIKAYVNVSRASYHVV
jgi:hypothetical protein